MLAGGNSAISASCMIIIFPCSAAVASTANWRPVAAGIFHRTHVRLPLAKINCLWVEVYSDSRTSRRTRCQLGLSTLVMGRWQLPKSPGGNAEKFRTRKLRINPSSSPPFGLYLVSMGVCVIGSTGASTEGSRVKTTFHKRHPWSKHGRGVTTQQTTLGEYSLELPEMKYGHQEACISTEAGNR